MNLVCRTTVILTLTLVGSQYGAADTFKPTRSKKCAIPMIDISSETQRQVVVERGTPTVYQGHVNTLLMPDKKTIWAVWTRGHGGPCGPMKKSIDGGLTWDSVNNKPSNLSSIQNCPTIHRLIDPAGKARLFIFAGNGDQCQACSEDGGQTWSAMVPNGLKGVVPPMSVLPVDNGRRVSMWYCGDPNGREVLPQKIWQADSTDGGLTWGHVRQVVVADAANPNEPTVIRSPDGRQLLMLIRVESGGFNSLYATSDNDGCTWSAPKELAASLTGHRHNARYAPDGRLVVVMRDTAELSPTKGSFVTWVGAYDDIIQGREGQYRIKLLHHYPNPNPADCGYAGLEVLPDGTFVATTYIKYTSGPEQNSIVSVRFKLSELDAKAARSPKAARAETPAERDQRMAWWRDARFGMFIHWGLYSIPAGVWKGKGVSGLSCWNPHTLSIPTAEWGLLARQFDPVWYNPRDWARLAKFAGMKYAVITVKHHEGFCLFDSKLTDFTAMHCPARRDLIREWVDAFRAEGLRVGFYYSLIDWHHPEYPVAGDPFHPERDRREVLARPRDLNKYLDYMHGQVRELLTNYGKIDVLWFDFSYEPKMKGETWRATELLKMVRSLQPEIIVNNRLDSAGDLQTGSTPFGDFSTPEQQIPERSGVNWETCMPIEEDWGYKSRSHNWKSTEALIRNLVDIASKGGNYLLNVGPTPEGVIPEVGVNRLTQIGRWMQVNGESIYGTVASPFPQQLAWGRCTLKYLPGGRTRLYLHVFDWPKDGRLAVPALGNRVSAAHLLADPQHTRLKCDGDGVKALTILLPAGASDPNVPVVAVDVDGEPKTAMP